MTATSPPALPPNVLSFEGGPSGVLTMRLLWHIERRCPGFLANTSVFAGTSFGSMMALFLAAHVTDDHQANLDLLERGRQYVDDLWIAMSPCLCSKLMFLTGLTPLIGVQGVANILERELGRRRFGDLNRRVVAVSFSESLHRPAVFDSFKLDLLGVDKTPTAVDVGLSSSAFPAFFPIHVGPGGRFLDGAIVANNPAMCALTRVVADLRAAGAADPIHAVTLLALGIDQRRWQAGWRGTLGDVLACLGRRRAPGDPNGHSIAWGWLAWVMASPFYDAILMAQGSWDEANRQSRLLLQDNFHPLFPPVNEVYAELLMGLFNKPETYIKHMDELAAQLASDPYSELGVTVDWVKRAWFPSAVAPPAGAASGG